MTNLLFFLVSVFFSFFLSNKYGLLRRVDLPEPLLVLSGATGEPYFVQMNSVGFVETFSFSRFKKTILMKRMHFGAGEVLFGNQVLLLTGCAVGMTYLPSLSLGHLCGMWRHNPPGLRRGFGVMGTAPFLPSSELPVKAGCCHCYTSFVFSFLGLKDQ